MRVICPFCANKAIITSSDSQNKEDTIKNLYCACSNAKSCGASFVYTLSFNHVLNPPSKTTTEMAFNLVNRMSENEKKILRNQLLC